MASNIVFLHNKSAKPKSIVHQGAQISIPGFGREHYVKPVAEKFLEFYPGVVVHEEEVDTVFAEPFQESSHIWLANVTGDPSQPDTVEGLTYYSKEEKRHKKSLIENPRKAPMNIRRFYDPGMQKYTAKDGSPEAYNLPRVPIDLPAYTRRQFPREVANWMLMRDAMAGKEARGRIIKSRPPSNFEPDLTWGLDEMRAYLKFCDPERNLGPSEEDLDNNEDAIAEAKREVWRSLFFCLVDPQVRLPTRREFQELMNGPPPPPRPRGRPPKIRPGMPQMSE